MPVHPSRRGVTAVALAALSVPFLSGTALTADAATKPVGTQVWAAPATAPSWVAPADTVQWYVATTALPSAALGKKVTIVATSPAAIDCANLGAGYGTDAGWVNLTPLRATCTSTRASWTFQVTSAMVGKEVSLNGWTAAGSATRTTVHGTVRALGQATTGSSTATKAVTPTPVGPLVALGSYNGQTVSVASGDLANQVWVGKKAYTAPDGALWHSSLDESLVNLWYQDGTAQLQHWQLDLATGAITTQTIAVAEVLKSGKPGFWVVTPQTSTLLASDVLYDWSGHARLNLGDEYWHYRIKDFTDTYAVMYGGGMTPTNVDMIIPDGSGIKAWSTVTPYSRLTVDPSGVTVSFASAPSCRVTYTSSTCAGSWAPAGSR